MQLPGYREIRHFRNTRLYLFRTVQLHGNVSVSIHT